MITNIVPVGTARRSEDRSGPQCSEPPAKVGSVQMGLSIISGNLDQLAKAIEILRNRLSPVFFNHPRAGNVNSDDAHPSSCELGEQAHARANDIAGLQQQVEELIERLDI